MPSSFGDKPVERVDDVPVLQPVRMANLAAQLDEVNPELELIWDSMMKNGQFIGGEAVADFERDFAQFTGAEHAIGVANGTDALEIILRSLPLEKGAAVMVPGNSFVTTA